MLDKAVSSLIALDVTVEQRLINIGLGELIALIDETCSKPVRKAFTWAVIIGGGLFVVGLPIKEVILPTIFWLGSIDDLNTQEFLSLRNGFSTAMWLLWLALVLALVVTAIQNKRQVNDGRRYVADAQAYLEWAEKVKAEAEDMRVEAQRILAESQRVSSVARRTARRPKLVKR